MRSTSSWLHIFFHTSLLLLVSCSLFLATKHIKEGYVRHQEVTATAVASTDIVMLTNQNRISIGEAELTVNPLLMKAAQMKADDMAQGSYYAHVSPDGKNMLYWFDQVGYHYLNAGENLIIDRTTSEQVVTAWMNSPDHRANILRPQFTEIGVGSAEGTYLGMKTTYVVQEFGTPYPTSDTFAPKALAKTSKEPAQVASVISTTTPAKKKQKKKNVLKVATGLATTSPVTSTPTTTVVRVAEPELPVSDPVILLTPEPPSRIQKQTTGSMALDTLKPIIDAVTQGVQILKSKYGK